MKAILDIDHGVGALGRRGLHDDVEDLERGQLGHDGAPRHRRDADVARLPPNVAVHADREAVPRYMRELGEHVYREVERLLGWIRVRIVCIYTDGLRRPGGERGERAVLTS